MGHNIFLILKKSPSLKRLQEFALTRISSFKFWVYLFIVSKDVI
ncbi:hypothetical protein SAMN05421766_11118 [Zobellia uliginosa]|uniref:Uncharacterized protein n=1 Tax=Zobellia uliginosa TaxID=143224 RepID=A0ABY1L1M3_9FLAO|nr:hypothetical protein SAMN05421766_11118 [Zobellia uliginosa]